MLSEENRPACLMVHGLSASPAQLVPQKEALEDAGFVVEAPLLSGHGTDIRDINGLRWEDWYADVLRAATHLRQRTGAASFDLVGMSFGALLGLKLAIDRPDLIRRLVVMGTPLQFYPWMRVVYPLVLYTPLRWFMQAWPKNLERSVADPEGRQVYAQAGYDAFPIRAIVQVRRLQKQVAPHLHQINAPTLIMHAHQDQTALPRSAEVIRQRVVGPTELLWLDRSYHVITLDYERDVVSARMLEFLRGA